MSKRLNIKRYNRQNKALEILHKVLARSDSGRATKAEVSRAVKKSQHAFANYLGLRGKRARKWPEQ